MALTGVTQTMSKEPPVSSLLVRRDFFVNHNSLTIGVMVFNNQVECADFQMVHGEY